MLHREGDLDGAVARIHIFHLQTVDDEGLIFLRDLRGRWQYVDWRIVDRAYIHMDGAIDLGAKGAVVEALGGDLEIQCTVGIIGHQLDSAQLAALGSDLPATATQINNRPRHAIWQADLGAIRHPFDGDPHLLGLVLMHITRTAAGWLGIPGLQPQIQRDHIPFGTARLTLNVGDKGIPHRIDGDGKAATGFERNGEPLVEGKGAQRQIHGAAEISWRDQGQLGEIGPHRDLPDAAAIVDRRSRQGEAIRYPLDLQRDDLLRAIIVDKGCAKSGKVDRAIFAPRDAMHRELGRIVDRSHLKADLPAPAAAVGHLLATDQRGIDDIDLDVERYLTAEVLFGHKHQVLEGCHIVDHQGVDRLATAIEEVTIFGIHRDGDPLHGFEAATRDGGADIGQFHREIEVDLAIFQIVRLSVMVGVLHGQSQFRMLATATIHIDHGGHIDPYRAAVDLDVATGGIGIHHLHLDIERAGKVLRQAEGQPFQASQ